MELCTINSLAYDSNFHNMIGYMLRLNGSVKDDKKLDALLGTRVVM